MSFAGLWESLLPIGRDDRTGGYRRYSWTDADLDCRAWFRAAAAERELPVSADRNGNVWAWWDPPGRLAGQPRSGAVVTGSHLDSVPDGGAFDGPLGVASGLAAIDLLRERGLTPVRPLAVAVFTEEEGARFGVACLGSRLLTGALDPGTARGLRDGAGVTLADAMAAAGQDPDQIGPDRELLSGIGAFVELHIEQGRALAEPLDAVLGIASGIWPHGRWLFDFGGQADHAGTARLIDRRDPMLPFAAAVIAAREAAGSEETLATFGKIEARPGAVNAISASVRTWLDARAPDQAALDLTVAAVRGAAEQAAREHSVALTVTQESRSPAAGFDRALRERIATVLSAAGVDAPELPTGAGHDAGVLAAHVPAAMLFVRNPTGVSHAPGEHAEPGDCMAGVAALAAVLEDLACR
jgi:N-carbamoyl-L-amino-acid hydrolase